MGVGGQRHTPAAFPLGMTRYPLYWGWGGPHGRSWWARKISPPPGFDPRTVLSVASRCTVWAIAVRTGYLKSYWNTDTEDDKYLGRPTKNGFISEAGTLTGVCWMWQRRRRKGKEKIRWMVRCWRTRTKREWTARFTCIPAIRPFPDAVWNPQHITIHL